MGQEPWPARGHKTYLPSRHRRIAHTKFCRVWGRKDASRGPLSGYHGFPVRGAVLGTISANSNGLQGCASISQTPTLRIIATPTQGLHRRHSHDQLRVPDASRGHRPCRADNRRGGHTVPDIRSSPESACCPRTTAREAKHQASLKGRDRSQAMEPRTARTLHRAQGRGPRGKR